MDLASRQDLCESVPAPGADAHDRSSAGELLGQTGADA
jgi:hypothetical protein